MTRLEPPRIASRRLALALAYGGALVSVWGFWEAYERRGARRPFLSRFIPGA